MIDLILGLVNKFSDVPVVEEAGVKTWTFKIPRNHPRATALIELFEILNNKVQLANGQIVEKPGYPDGVELFLKAMNEAVGDEGFGEIMAELDQFGTQNARRQIMLSQLESLVIKERKK